MFPAIQFYITECIQQTLAGVTLVEQLFQNYSNNHYQCKNYRNHNSNSTIVCGQSVSKVKTTFLDLLETLGSQLRARWGRDITFYWWRCWCYPEQRLLRDGDDFCDSCRLYLVWWRGIPVLPRNVMESVGRIPCCGGVVIISVTGWGIKCLNMEILKETLSNDCTESSGYLQGSRCLH